MSKYRCRVDEPPPTTDACDGIPGEWLSAYSEATGRAPCLSSLTHPFHTVGGIWCNGVDERGEYRTEVDEGKNFDHIKIFDYEKHVHIEECENLYYINIYRPDYEVNVSMLNEKQSLIHPESNHELRSHVGRITQ